MTAHPIQDDRSYRLSKDWVRYEGPFGGEGWQHIETGEVRYTDDPPGEVAADNQVQTTLPGEGYELPVDLSPPKWIDSPGDIGRILEDEFFTPDGEYNPRLEVADLWFENDDYSQDVEGFLDATSDWLTEHGDSEMAARLQDRLAEYDGMSPWGDTGAPDYLNPENATELTPLLETEAHDGISARSMMIGEMESGDRLFITNLNDDLPADLTAEEADEALAAEQAAQFLDELGVNVPDHHYEPGEFLAVAEADGSALGDLYQQRFDHDEFLGFAATQILVGNDDAHEENVFYSYDGLSAVDLDLAATDFANDSRSFAFGLGKLFDTGTRAGLYEPYDADEKEHFVEALRDEVRAWAEGDMVIDALDAIEDDEIRERIENNVQAARNGELFDDDQRVQSGL